MYFKPQQLRVRIRISLGASEGIEGAMRPDFDKNKLHWLSQVKVYILELVDRT
jgi:hypothetical protein